MTVEIVSVLTDIVGSENILTGREKVAGREFPWATHSACQAKAILMPESVDAVSAILQACNQVGQSVVPFGGTTNLVQGCATASDDIALSLERLNKLENVDTSARTLTVEAGVTLETAQTTAAEAGLFFPVDIGARATCQLGGLVAMNAGGNKVIRYGMTRDTVLGLEVVLADGTVVSSMNRYIKNNSGFDLKHMFIGSEGVLGIITRCVFRLRSRPRSHNVALLACDAFDDVIAVLEAANKRLPDTLSAFEVMWNSFYELAVQPRGRLAAPLEPGAAHYVLVESMGVDQEHDTLAFEDLLEELMTRNLLADGMLAKSERERQLIWEIRDEVEPVIDGAHNFDVSLRSADVGDYVDEVSAAIHTQYPQAGVIAFGHLGDNNVHVSVSGLDRLEGAVQNVEEIIYGCLRSFAGAISAEHGIGLEKKAYLPISRTAAEIGLMTALKRQLDPNNILNPGKVVDVAES